MPAENINTLVDRSADLAEPILNLTHEYKTHGKFKVIEHGIHSKNIVQKMLERFGEITSYNLEQLPSAEYRVTFKASVVAKQGLKFLLPKGKLEADLIDFHQDLDKNYKGLISDQGNLKVYANTVDFMQTGLVFNQGLIWAPRGTEFWIQ